MKFDIPRYYDIDFKRKRKKCPTCGKKMAYDGWGDDLLKQKVDEWWYCKKCDKLYKF